MQQLTKGANASLNALRVRAQVTWTGPTGVDISALLCRADGRVASDSDLVFFNQPTHPCGAVRHTSGTTVQDAGIDLELDLLPAAIESVRVVVSSDEPLARIGAPTLTVTDNETTNSPRRALVAFSMQPETETAIVAAELYRRGGTWKVRAVGQGYADGLAGLARDFGISVDDPDPAPITVPARGPASRTVAFAEPRASAPDMSQPQPRREPATGGAATIDWLNPPVPAGYES